MTDRKKIEARIEELRGELSRAEGTPTEVYSRIVGYYRSVRNWNAGKREEYGQRLAFAMPSSLPAAEPAAPGAEPTALPQAEPRRETAAREGSAVAVPAVTASAMALPGGANLRDGVLVFTREACPNCSPVANYVIASGIKALFVDVDRDEGLSLARDLGVMATPTVLGLDGDGRESFRAFDVSGLRSRIQAAQGLAEGVRCTPSTAEVAQ